MTEEQLKNHRQWCRLKYNSSGDDIFQTAVLIALERYKTLENVNQSLFGMLCKEAFRNIKNEESQYITFSDFVDETADDFDEQFDFADENSMNAYRQIEIRNELENILSKKCLEKLLNDELEPEPASKVKAKEYIQESLFA